METGLPFSEMSSARSFETEILVREDFHAPPNLLKVVVEYSLNEEQPVFERILDEDGEEILRSKVSETDLLRKYLEQRLRDR